MPTCTAQAIPLRHCNRCCQCHLVERLNGARVKHSSYHMFAQGRRHSKLRRRVHHSAVNRDAHRDAGPSLYSLDTRMSGATVSSLLSESSDTQSRLSSVRYVLDSTDDLMAESNGDTPYQTAKRATVIRRPSKPITDCSSVMMLESEWSDSSDSSRSSSDSDTDSDSSHTLTKRTCGWCHRCLSALNTGVISYLFRSGTISGIILLLFVISIFLRTHFPRFYDSHHLFALSAFVRLIIIYGWTISMLFLIYQWRHFPLGPLNLSRSSRRKSRENRNDLNDYFRDVRNSKKRKRRNHKWEGLSLLSDDDDKSAMDVSSDADPSTEYLRKRIHRRRMKYRLSVKSNSQALWIVCLPAFLVLFCIEFELHSLGWYAPYGSGGVNNKSVLCTSAKSAVRWMFPSEGYSKDLFDCRVLTLYYVYGFTLPVSMFCLCWLCLLIYVHLWQYYLARILRHFFRNRRKERRRIRKLRRRHLNRFGHGHRKSTDWCILQYCPWIRCFERLIWRKNRMDNREGNPMFKGSLNSSATTDGPRRVFVTNRDISKTEPNRRLHTISVSEFQKNTHLSAGANALESSVNVTHNPYSPLQRPNLIPDYNSSQPVITAGNPTSSANRSFSHPNSKTVSTLSISSNFGSDIVDSLNSQTWNSRYSRNESSTIVSAKHDTFTLVTDDSAEQDDDLPPTFKRVNKDITRLWMRHWELWSEQHWNALILLLVGFLTVIPTMPVVFSSLQTTQKYYETMFWYLLMVSTSGRWMIRQCSRKLDSFRISIHQCLTCCCQHRAQFIRTRKHSVRQGMVAPDGSIQSRELSNELRRDPNLSIEILMDLFVSSFFLILYKNVFVMEDPRPMQYGLLLISHYSCELVELVSKSSLVYFSTLWGIQSCITDNCTNLTRQREYDNCSLPRWMCVCECHTSQRHWMLFKIDNDWCTVKQWRNRLSFDAMNRLLLSLVCAIYIDSLLMAIINGSVHKISGIHTYRNAMRLIALGFLTDLLFLCVVWSLYFCCWDTVICQSSMHIFSRFWPYMISSVVLTFMVSVSMMNNIFWMKYISDST